MPKVAREGNMASSEGGNEVVFTGTDCPFSRIGKNHLGGTYSTVILLSRKKPSIMSDFSLSIMIWAIGWER
jgi:hypothetical protein